MADFGKFVMPPRSNGKWSRDYIKYVCLPFCMVLQAWRWRL